MHLAPRRAIGVEPHVKERGQERAGERDQHQDDEPGHAISAIAGVFAPVRIE